MRYALILPIILLFACSAPKPEGVQVINSSRLQELMENEKDLVIIDVRTPAETSGGMIPGALNFDWQESAFASQIASLDPDKPVVVYCASGIRSAQAADKLNQENFSVVYDYSEGYYGWVNNSGK